MQLGNVSIFVQVQSSQVCKLCQGGHAVRIPSIRVPSVLRRKCVIANQGQALPVSVQNYFLRRLVHERLLLLLCMMLIFHHGPIFVGVLAVVDDFKG